MDGYVELSQVNHLNLEVHKWYFHVQNPKNLFYMQIKAYAAKKLYPFQRSDLLTPLNKEILTSLPLGR